jgi:ribose/xylose/arabinose/galactoside ABC-type transport system permease subunit
VLLNYTVPGRYLHAIGSNRAAARISGIHVGRYLVMAFVVAGVCAAFAGVLQTARNGSATPTAGAPFLLPAYAAAFLGSTALRRGQFHIVGTVLGVYLIATGSAGFIILGAPFYTQQLFSGAVLLLATMGSRFLSRRRQRCGRHVTRGVCILWTPLGCDVQPWLGRDAGPCALPRSCFRRQDGSRDCRRGVTDGCGAA